MRLAWAALVTIVACATPTAGAQSAIPVDHCSRECDPAAVNPGAPRSGDAIVEIVLYGHFFDVLNHSPLNTQVPDPWTEKVLDGGFSAPTLDTNTNLCLPSSNTCADFHFKNNDFTMVLQPDEVRPGTENPQNAFAPETAYDLTIAAPVVHVYWYLSAESTRGANGPVGVVPALGIHGELGTGGFQGHGTLL